MKSRLAIRSTIAAAFSMLLGGCLGMPEYVKPVTGFELDRYLGTWYEIARLDHSFERGLEKVSAEYSLRENGTLRVLNRGYSPSDQEWREAEGTASFVQSPDTGYLKVSFFGPFYGSYVVFALDQQDYSYAYVSGPDNSYLWFLSRTPDVTKERIEHFLTEAQSRGFNPDNLIFVKH